MCEFLDEEGLFSLKNIVETGKELVKKDYGDWYGVNSISRVLNAINSQNSHFQTFKTIVFGDGIVVLNDIKMHGIDADEMNWINSVMVMIPI